MTTDVRWATWLAATAIACGSAAPSGAPAPRSDAAPLDTSLPFADAGPDDAGADDGALLDAIADAPPDAEVALPDLTPPGVVRTVPATGAATWLHAPIRFELDEAVLATNLGATAVLDGVTIAATATLAPTGDALVVTLDRAARGTGALEVQITGEVRDYADNAMTTLPSIALAVPAWLRPPIDSGAALDAPSIVASSSGVVALAWPVDDGGVPRIVVGTWIEGQWCPVGGPRGQGPASEATVALDHDGRPIVGYLDAGAPTIERWDGSSWSVLPAPVTGERIALASAPDGTVMLAITEAGTTRMFELVASVWVPRGAVTATGTIVGDLEISVGGAGRLAVGWMERTGANDRVVVHRYAGAWTAMEPIALPAGPGGAASHLSLAMRGTTLAVAFERWTTSSNVSAAVARGDQATTWTALGTVLDVDVPGPASAPSIAIDADDAPVIAWHETIEGAHRGVLARWGGSAWTVLGGSTWLREPVVPTRPRVSLVWDRVPVIVYEHGASVALAMFNGSPPPGVTRAPLAGCAFAASSPPARLSQTGCFQIPSPGRAVAHPGLVPYDLNAELWSDGTKKRRWIALAGSSAMGVTSNGSWAAPSGSFVVKEFAIETTPGDPATRRVIETRILVADGGAWSGFSYRWRADGTDADLMSDGTTTATWSLSTGGSYTHVYPSRSQCRSCHHTSHGPLLGLRAEQLARWFDYDGVIADQLRTLAEIGVAPVTTATPLPSPDDPAQSTHARARAYLHANCAHCHNGSYVTVRDMRFSTPLSQARMCDVIVPGDPSSSRLHQVVTQRPGMPPLGTLVVDPRAGDLIGGWISSLTACP